MTKTLFTLTLSLSMLLGLSACQKNDENHGNPDKNVAPHALDKES